MLRLSRNLNGEPEFVTSYLSPICLCGNLTTSRREPGPFWLATDRVFSFLKKKRKESRKDAKAQRGHEEDTKGELSGAKGRTIDREREFPAHPSILLWRTTCAHLLHALSPAG